MKAMPSNILELYLIIHFKKKYLLLKPFKVPLGLVIKNLNWVFVYEENRNMPHSPQTMKAVFALSATYYFPPGI